MKARSDELYEQVSENIVHVPQGVTVDHNTSIPLKAMRPLCDAVATLEQRLAAIEEEKGSE